MSLEVLKELQGELEAGRSAVLVSIISFRGSVPRKDHPRALFLKDGRQSGTVGGGCLDGQARSLAGELFERGGSLRRSHTLDVENAQEAGLHCGGSVELEGRRFDDLPEDRALLEELLADPELVPPRLFVFGGGHVGLASARLAHGVGFAVSVIDDRVAFANSERFPFAEACVSGPPEAADELPTLGARDAIFIMTRAHQQDLGVLEWACGTGAGHIGLLGSTRKRDSLLRLLVEHGYSLESLEGRFHSPVGVEIGAATPEEIGLAAVAELVNFRRGASA